MGRPEQINDGMQCVDSPLRRTFRMRIESFIMIWVHHWHLEADATYEAIEKVEEMGCSLDACVVLSPVDEGKVFLIFVWIDCVSLEHYGMPLSV
jgi:hypothetical protein